MYAIPNNDGYVVSLAINGDINTGSISKKNIETNTLKDDNGLYLYKVVDGEVVDTTDIDRTELYKQILINRIKIECNAIIISKYPEWKQRNMIAKFAELNAKTTLTAEEITTRDGLLAVWSWVEFIREQSNAMELEVSVLSYSNMLNYEIIFNTVMQP